MHDTPVHAAPQCNPLSIGMVCRLDDVVTDGREGDLMVMSGAGLGNEQRPHLVMLHVVHVVPPNQQCNPCDTCPSCNVARVALILQ